MGERMQSGVVVAAGVLLVLAGFPPEALAQWTVTMRAMQNPIPVGQCAAIEIVPRDATGAPPVRPDGRQLDWQDFELEFTATVPEAFAWSNPRHRFLCARAAVSSLATVTAHYPGAHLRPDERIPGIDVRQTLGVTNLVQPGPAASAPVPQLATTPATPGPAGPAHTAPSAAAVPSAPASTPGSAPAAAQPGVRSVGGFFETVGAHAKRKAGEVTSETAQNIAAGATSVVDTAFETVGGVVSSATLEATNGVRSSIGRVGRSLTPVALRGGESSDNLATAIAGSGAELRMLRFIGATDLLEPASRDLVERLAEALNAVRGNFVVECHIDPLPSPTEAQQLSEQRAAAVKQALIRKGVTATRLKALGYGASEPRPAVPPGGGPPSSARIVVVREPPPTS